MALNNTDQEATASGSGILKSLTSSQKSRLQNFLNRARWDGETTTTIKGGRSTSKNRSIKYVCPKCGAIIRATKLVNVVCGDCDIAFEIAK